MSLRKLKVPVPVAVVQVSDEDSFPVRGLNPSDLLGLYHRHTGELSGLFEKLAASYQANGNNVEAADVQQVAFALLQDAPQILAEVIAIAADGDPSDEENWAIDVAIAGKLPFPVQADALQKIGALTFTSDMPPGKFVALVAGAVMKATEAASSFRNR